MILISHSFQPKPFQTGFTLLEMVLVLFLISLMASATLFLTENVEDQAKYDETKRRMEIIRQAIVGDPTRKLNGQTEISGFASDMGRLPECLAELLTQRNCANDDDLPDWEIELTTGIAFGWRGPYIQVTPERSGQLHFRDGYANPDTSGAQNSGWEYLIDTSGAASILSEGFDFNTTDDNIEDNELVSPSDWLVNLPSTISVNITNQSTVDIPSSASLAISAIPPANATQTALNLTLLIYLDDLDSPIGTSEVSTLSTSEAIAGSTITKIFTINAPDDISIGTRGYVIACDAWDHDSNASTAISYTAFSGSNLCSENEISRTDLRSVTVAPRKNINLDWTIQ